MPVAAPYACHTGSHVTKTTPPPAAASRPGRATPRAPGGGLPGAAADATAGYRALHVPLLRMQ
ncbi:hypothetical protein Acsp04_05690 [Actinomadura sp. NBRC 104425]|nr:hypothetical protein Acsp04_05690 [Actinomadura sp. NBRC 104425]